MFLGLAVFAPTSLSRRLTVARVNYAPLRGRWREGEGVSGPLAFCHVIGDKLPSV